MVLAAAVAGLAVFLLLWLGQRENGQPDRGDAQAPAAAAPVFQPLPTPSGTGFSARPDGAEAPLRDGGARIDEPTAPQAQPRPTVPGSDRPVPGGDVAGSPAGPASSPVPVSSPSPRYPTRALRRGESGEVLLRVHVDVRGAPERIEVASSSGSRDLDRAAIAGVRRWRFSPAMQGGAPVAGTVNVPIRFDSGR